MRRGLFVVFQKPNSGVIIHRLARSRFRVVRSVTLAIPEAEGETPPAPDRRVRESWSMEEPCLAFRLHGHPTYLGTVRPGAGFKRHRDRG
jgi:hypothetical protein